ncbi:TPA: hypothetical protein ENG04_13120 [Candidatus Poribacteria bacterium]|nr:hypothetical protein [Candidatus Poribacteria bacterium]HEX31015.1 hypothetical protein [Candidatus Poribacteria bacterium]
MLKAGAAQRDITPLLGISLVGYFHDRKAVDVRDPLYAKAIVLEADGERIAIVLCDLIALEREEIEKARELIESRCGILPQNVMIACTHTHTGPATVSVLGVDRDEGYLEFLIPRIADTVQMACQRLREAKVGWEVGREERISFNRRYWMKDGKVRTNPGYNNPDIVRPAGPIDPDVMAIRIADAQGNTIAVLANFALHYVGGSPSNVVSADYFGMFAQEIQRMHGESFVAILSNGCCGDINNIDVHNPPERREGYEHAQHVASILAADVYSLTEHAKLIEDVQLNAASKRITIPVRPITEEMIESAKAILRDAPDDVNRYTREQIYAREILFLSEMPRQVETEVQVFAIRSEQGEMAIVGLPGEIFVEIGLQIKKSSPFKATMTIELANDWVGYVPTEKAFEEGGYETELARSSKLVPEAERILIQTARELLESV